MDDDDEDISAESVPVRARRNGSMLRSFFQWFQPASGVISSRRYRPTHSVSGSSRSGDTHRRMFVAARGKRRIDGTDTRNDIDDLFEQILPLSDNNLISGRDDKQYMASVASAAAALDKHNKIKAIVFLL